MRPWIAEASQRLVNLLVLRELTRLVAHWKALDAANRRALRIALPIVAIALAAAAGYALWNLGERKQAMRLAACGAGEEATRERRHQTAVSLLTQCLDAAGRSAQERAHAFKLRAWSHARLGRPTAAASDQEAAFALVPGTTYRDLLDYAVYLRDAGRPADSLQAVLAAERVEGGRISMMTQYHKGWILQELGRHAEAVEAFTTGLVAQPSYAFAYWRRGLAYERMGERRRAAADFAQCAQLLTTGKATPSEGETVAAIRAKLREYGLHDKFPL